jgi:hypothetical protein
MSDPLEWLLEPDAANPGVRYFALKDLLDRPRNDPEVQEAQAAVMQSGPVPAILAAQDPQGWWCKAGAGYGPKYRSTVWSVTFLAMLGADGREARVRGGCAYVLDHARTPAPYGGFTIGGLSGMVHCLEGNLAAALLDLGWLGDPRLDEAIGWLARSITGEGIAPATEAKAAPRYHRSGNSGPGFLCSANNHLPCAWGAVKAMLALGKIPPAKRTPAVQKAIAAGVDFLLSRDPAVADYPSWNGGKASASWFRFGYPLAYVTDLLQNIEALTALGYGGDPRLREAIDVVLSKRQKDGRWLMKYTYNGKMWADIEQNGRPSKWVTLRAMRVLKKAK